MEREFRGTSRKQMKVKNFIDSSPKQNKKKQRTQMSIIFPLVK